MAREITRDNETLFRPRSGAPPEAETDDFPRVLDLEPEQESPFLRAQKRVPVRRGPLAKKTANRLKQVLIALAAAGLVVILASVLYQYGQTSWRFRIRSGENIEIAGSQNVSRRQVLQAFGADLGRNIFFVPLADRRSQVEAIPWVESATVMRLLPDRLRVGVTERVPAAFVRMGSRVSVIDRNGVVMEMPASRIRKYSFPVIKGMSESEPVSTRAARMQIYSALMQELDSEGARYSQDISEVDLSDPEDVKVVAADPGGAVLVHLGSSDFLRRYKIYIAHVAQWRQQFQKLDSVDLRYERQIIVNPDSAPPKPAGPKPAPPKAVVRPPAAPQVAKTVAQATGPKTPAANTKAPPARPSPRPKNDSGTQ